MIINWVKQKFKNKIEEREKALKVEQDAVLERHRILAEADKANKEAKRLIERDKQKELEKERQKKRVQREMNTVRTQQQQRTSNSMPYYSNHDSTITPTSIVMHDTFMHDSTPSRSHDNSCSQSYDSGSSSSYDSGSSSSSYDSGSSSSYSSCD